MNTDGSEILMRRAGCLHAGAQGEEGGDGERSGRRGSRRAKALAQDMEALTGWGRAWIWVRGWALGAVARMECALGNA